MRVPLRVLPLPRLARHGGERRLRRARRARRSSTRRARSRRRACWSKPGTGSAEFVIGSDITIKVKEVPCGFAKCTRDDLDVDISWFGTGIRRIGEARRVTHEVPPLMLSMMTVGRGRKARDNKIGADDDDETKVVLAAEEAEELALQADEDLSTGDD